MWEKVLVVDDERQIRDLLKEFLTNEAYEVILASNGKEAIELTEREHPDAILLDVKMPEIDGIEVCQRLKEEPSTQFIPIIVITGYVDNKMVAIEAGADDFVHKPINLTELGFRVKSILRTRYLTNELERAVAHIRDPEKHPTDSTKGVLRDTAVDERSIDAFIQWEKCKRGAWCILSELDLDHEHFKDMEGVYVIWQGEENPVALRAGQGFIRECLVRDRNDKDLLAYREQHELYVTWAKVNPRFRDGVFRYVSEALKPELENSYPDVSPIGVNLPWYEISFPWE
jgi:DNA-binding response OmpR family regulator